jgi:PAS domain S-box-containing protein
VSGRSISEAEFIRVRRELQLKSDALENSLNGFDIVDAQGNLIYANRAYLKMWGYERLEEIIGTPAAGHCADPSVPGKIIRTLREEGQCNIEFLALRKDGSTFDVQMLARVAHDAEGNEIYPTTSIDITERKSNEAKLHEAIRTRDEFLSIASHELRTPLTSLQMQADIRARSLSKNETAPWTRDQLLKMVEMDRNQIRRLSRLIDDMLDISRINTGKLTVQKERFDLSRLVREVLERYETPLAAAKCPVVVVRSEVVEGEWDRFRFEQVIANLLSNAMKYAAGTRIEISVFREGDRARFEVRDNGRGIAPEDHARIFERFERVASPYVLGGLGLGLYIVRHIVEMHGGTIRVESAPGKGAAFLVDVPLVDSKA